MTGTFYYGKYGQAKLQERFCSGGIMTEKCPYRTWFAGVVTFIIFEVHLYHKANIMGGIVNLMKSRSQRPSS
jgi:hypothetical protein